MMDKNDITGTTNTVCTDSNKLDMLVVDCDMTCPCCTFCCETDDDDCNDAMWMGDINPIWELGYKRSDRVFDAPPKYSQRAPFKGEVP